MLNAVLSHPEVVGVRLNDIDNVDSYAMIAAFMSANKLTYSMRRDSIPHSLGPLVAFTASPPPIL